MKTVMYCVGIACLAGVITLMAVFPQESLHVTQPIRDSELGDSPIHYAVVGDRGDRSAPHGSDGITSRVAAITKESVRTVQVSDLSGDAATCMNQINRVLSDNKKPPIEPGALIAESDLPALVESWQGLYANYEASKTSYEQAAAARVRELRKSLQAALLEGAPIPFDEMTSFAPRNPGEHVSACQPANSTRWFALRVQRHELQPHADGVDAALHGLVYFSNESARNMFSR